MPDPRKSRPSLNFIEASRIRFCGKYGPQAMASQAKLPVGRIKCGWPERGVSEPMITTARRRKPAWASCPKMRTEPKARILEAFSRFAETSRRDTGSAIGAPEQTSPPDHPFRPAGAPELLCGGAVVITEQTAQSLTTSRLPVRTADAFFRFEQRVPKPSVVNFLSRSRMRNRLPCRKPSNGSVRFRPTCIMNGPSGPGVIPAMCTFREDSSMTSRARHPLRPGRCS